MLKCYELNRVLSSTPQEIIEQQRAYRINAMKLKQKYGKRAAYRYEWLLSAWSFRFLLRNMELVEAMRPLYQKLN